jgi:vancomycin resistance protein VanJ
MLVLLVIVLGLQAVAPQASGPLALTEIFEPFLILAALPLVPFAVRRPEGRAALALIAVFVVARYGPVFVSLPPTPSPAYDQIRVDSWNLQGDRTASDVVIERLATTAADVVALQELTFATATSIEADERLLDKYPFRILHPEGRFEMGILSTIPITSEESNAHPKTMEAILDTGAGSIAMITVHPLPAGVDQIGPLPAGLDAARRDADLRSIRERVDRVRSTGLPVILVGDLNATEREPAYAEVARGLLDAHLLAGQGYGASWRPAVVRDLPLGMLRIDYVLTSPDLVPVEFHTDCEPLGSDHCRISATLVRTAPEPDGE